MVKQKGKILIAITCVALFICIATLSITVVLGKTVNRIENETSEFRATITSADVSSLTGSMFVKISTEAPQLTLCMPPYVTEYLDAELLDAFVPGSVITFKIAIEDQEDTLSGNPATIYSLSINDNAVFTLSEYNAYMSRYVQPIKTACRVVGGFSFCVMMCCLFAALRKRNATSNT